MSISIQDNKKSDEFLKKIHTNIPWEKMVNKEKVKFFFDKLAKLYQICSSFQELIVFFYVGE